MKQRLITLTLLLLSCPCFAKQLPSDIQHYLDSLKNNAQIKLYNYNIDDNYNRKGELYFLRLRDKFPYELWETLDKYNLNLDMIYDDAMRDRLVELVQYKFREYELDTLMTRYIGYNVMVYEAEIFKACRFDTLQIFISTMDSLLIMHKNNNTFDRNKEINNVYNYEVFKSLQFDTTVIFKHIYNKKVEREREREHILNHKIYNRTGLAELCGQIGDKRFIKPLIEALDKPDNFERETVLEALARMQVEPYYSEYVKFRMPRTIEQIKNESPGFKIDDFVYVLGTQEAFLELSKYLLSNYMYSVDMASAAPEVETQMHITPMSMGALMLIRDNIENKDLQAIFPDRYTYSHPELAQPVYDWMQKNYGKYKIKRIW